MKMQIIRFVKDEKPERLDELEKLPEQGFAWLDFVREETPDWGAEVRRLTGVEIHEAHVSDSFNESHPSFYEGTDAYEMIIFRGLLSSDIDTVESRPTAFFLFANLVVTVRSRDSVAVCAISKRLFERVLRAPRSSVGFMLLVLGAIVDRFMSMRDPHSQRLEEWQDALLDPSHPFEDWMSLMRDCNRLRRLERLCDEQSDALRDWCGDTSQELDEPLTVRANELMEHIRRVLTHTQQLQAQLESLVQVHFAAVAHRTNDIMRVLTVLAAVFLPLTFAAGVFGMNFEHMPELGLRHAYFVTLGLMLLLGLGMLYYFRRKRWI